jgi:hypothetical protein
MFTIPPLAQDKNYSTNKLRFVHHSNTCSTQNNVKKSGLWLVFVANPDDKRKIDNKMVIKRLFKRV